ncbi:hypothetical protein G6F68_015870 [Rhizopus microsporus]|nr:hypothetical protein G6F68_015870 [Rhizopus microsporus]
MLDQEALLAPISENAPTGEDLSFSAEFDRIIENRRADDPTLDQGAWQTDIKYADWSSVLREADSLLQTRTKDLRLAGWLSEAATQLEGFQGLAAGYRVTAGLCDRFWDELAADQFAAVAAGGADHRRPAGALQPDRFRACPRPRQQWRGR